jgi:anti-anti-sigma regulatory factor
VTALERALHGPQLHVDLSEVTFVDTTVVRTLIQARMAASEFELVVSPALRKLLDLAAVTDLLNVVGEPDPV